MFGAHVHEPSHNSYPSFCGWGRPLLGFILKTSTLRPLIGSDLTGEKEKRLANSMVAIGKTFDIFLNMPFSCSKNVC
jgi:hypothetical protein